MSQVEELVWHNDGHQVLILVDREDVAISLQYCPHNGKEGGDCWSEEIGGCVVRYFVDIYGFACNLGMAPASEFKEISWALRRGRDIDTSEVRIMPTADEEFSTWMEEQMEGIDPEGTVE